MKGAIRWMVDNHVTANLIMLLAIFGGLFALSAIKQEIFPEIPLDIVTVSVIYPGASPEDVEEAIISRVEDAIDSVDGIEKISSTSNESIGMVMAELEIGQDVQIIKDRIKNEIDRITSFPKEAEKPIVSELVRRKRVIDVGLYGDVSERILKESAEKLRLQLLQDPGISKVEVSGLKNYEIAIEISEQKLREFKLSFSAITQAVKVGSLDMPGGKIVTKNGDILLRTKSLGKTKEDYENVIISSDYAGRTLYLKDVATVKDGFEDVDLHTYFDGKPAALLSVFRVADQQPIAVANAVKKYIKNNQKNLPHGLKMVAWKDRAQILKARLNLLLRNALQGFILVLIILSLFLEIRLA
ncbi:efflux RND transporter permease subunit, partial [bacterium]|nr:efflux RND transporter permease subunit [bacterium]